MKQSIAATMRRIQRMPLCKQYECLKALKDAERPRSVLRGEYQKELGSILLRDMNAGKRGLKRKGVS